LTCEIFAVAKGIDNDAIEMQDTSKLKEEIESSNFLFRTDLTVILNNMLDVEMGKLVLIL
jgi:hypothetical protein